ncbi:2009_t:CDS:1, partial [Acaulospora colombiana]
NAPAPPQGSAKRPRKSHYDLYREVVRRANATRQQSVQESVALLALAQSSPFLSHLPSPISRISSLVSAHAPALRRVASARVDEASRQPSRVLTRSRTISTPLPPVPIRSNAGSSQGRVTKIKQELMKFTRP